MMITQTVLIGCDWIKTKNVPNILVYNKKISQKEYIQKHQNVKIFDIDDLKELSIKHNSKLIEYL